MDNACVADRTALIVIDLYHDFMTEGGKFYDLIKPTANESGMFDNLRDDPWGEFPASQQ